MLFGKDLTTDSSPYQNYEELIFPLIQKCEANLRFSFHILFVFLIWNNLIMSMPPFSKPRIISGLSRLSYLHYLKTIIVLNPER